MGLPEPVPPISCDLADLEPLTIHEVSGAGTERAWVKAALARFHYLGFGGGVVENPQYLIRDGRQGPSACVVFGSAAWKCQDRDRLIG